MKDFSDIKMIPNANLTIHPFASPAATETKPICGVITIGDLHGNALKLLYFLAERGAITVGNAVYKELAKIYQIPTDSLTKKDIKQFEFYLDATLVNPCVIRLIGDEFCDRGNNDYFTLLILDNISRRGIKINRLESNHGEMFFERHQKILFSDIPKHHKEKFISFDNLKTLIDKRVVSKKAVDAMIFRTLVPATKVIDYSVDFENKQIEIFTHAPVGFETIKAASELCGIEYKYSTLEELCQTIDGINRVYAAKLAKNTQHELFKSIKNSKEFISYKDYQEKRMSKHGISTDYPFARLFWNRYFPDKKLTEKYKITNPDAARVDYEFTFGHGHEGELITDAEFKEISNKKDVCAARTDLDAQRLLATEEFERQDKITMQTGEDEKSFLMNKIKRESIFVESKVSVSREKYENLFNSHKMTLLEKREMKSHLQNYKNYDNSCGKRIEKRDLLNTHLRGGMYCVTTSRKPLTKESKYIQLISKLERYLLVRQVEKDCGYKAPSFFSKIKSISHRPETIKFSAAEKLILLIKGSKNISFSDNEAKALKEGRLATISAQFSRDPKLPVERDTDLASDWVLLKKP